MKATLQVQGMMCGHCENRVIQACGELNGINKIQASAKEHCVVCDFDEAIISIDQIKAVIEDVGYDVVD